MLGTFLLAEIITYVVPFLYKVILMPTLSKNLQILSVKQNKKRKPLPPM